MAPPCPARRKNLRRRLHDVEIAGKCLAERGHLGGFIGELLTGAERRETGDDDRVLRAVAQQLRLLQVRVQLHLHMPLGLHLGYLSRPSRDALAWRTAGGMTAYDSTSRSAHAVRLHAPMLRARPERARPSIACAGVATTYVRRRGTAPPPSFYFRASSWRAPSTWPHTARAQPPSSGGRCRGRAPTRAGSAR